MNVIFRQLTHKTSILGTVKHFLFLGVVFSATTFHSASLQAETHANLQAVTSAGTSAWNGSFPFQIQGILLCDPDEMLSSTPNFLPWNDGQNQYKMGGEWQITFQASEAGDRGGTTCWMGQNYGNQPWIHNSELSYTNEAWAAEILRLNHDSSTLRAFKKGDLIEVTVRQSLFYGGKRNINEGHDINPSYNFDMKLITPNYGLPIPETITLADVMNIGGNADDKATWQPIFDSTRATGGEHWQGMRVRLNNLLLINSTNWNPNNSWSSRLCTVTDGEGRFFSLRHPRYSLGAAPTGKFDAVGIFNQESGSGSQGTNGYELFVQQVLPQNAIPELSISLNATISWPQTSDQYQLYSRDQADSGEWILVTNAPVVVNGKNTVILTPENRQRYYQLQKLK